MQRIIVLIICIIFISACSSGINYLSENNNININVDGNYEDWQGILKPIEKQGLVAGFIKQKDKIYLCFVISDKLKINKILRFGATVYLKNEIIESIGIKYPIIDNITEIKPKREFDNEEILFNKERNFEEINAKVLDKFNEFSIVNKDEYPLNTYLIDSKTNYKLKMLYKDYKLVYELAIDTQGLNIEKDIKELTDLQIGFVSNSIDFKREKNPPDFDYDEPDFRGDGNRMQITNRRIRDDKFEEMQKPFEFWFNVKFSQN
ncbi:MAG TPA: hypothetical protein PL041_09260 [Melioribacteraceae bacterium]|nr:hypothetical protein [Melioribacteraceae bacterium]